MALPSAFFSDWLEYSERCPKKDSSCLLVSVLAKPWALSIPAGYAICVFFVILMVTVPSLFVIGLHEDIPR